LTQEPVRRSVPTPTQQNEVQTVICGVYHHDRQDLCINQARVSSDSRNHEHKYAHKKAVSRKGRVEGTITKTFK